MSGSGWREITTGSPTGTSWNWAQLEVILHAFQMPSWNDLLLPLYKGGAWNRSKILTAPWLCNGGFQSHNISGIRESGVHRSSLKGALTITWEGPWVFWVRCQFCVVILQNDEPQHSIKCQWSKCKLKKKFLSVSLLLVPLVPSHTKNLIPRRKKMKCPRSYEDFVADQEDWGRQTSPGA